MLAGNQVLPRMSSKAGVPLRLALLKDPGTTVRITIEPGTEGES